MRWIPGVMSSALLLQVLVLQVLSQVVNGFNFSSTSQPGQCDDMVVQYSGASWRLFPLHSIDATLEITGGQKPITLSLIPVGPPVPPIHVTFFILNPIAQGHTSKLHARP